MEEEEEEEEEEEDDDDDVIFTKYFIHTLILFTVERCNPLR
jgi:hypothetical protein